MAVEAALILISCAQMGILVNNSGSFVPQSQSQCNAVINAIGGINTVGSIMLSNTCLLTLTEGNTVNLTVLNNFSGGSLAVISPNLAIVLVQELP